MQQALLDNWFLRQDIMDQLLSREEDESEAARFADRVVMIAQNDGAEHQVLEDHSIGRSHWSFHSSKKREWTLGILIYQRS